MARKGRGGGSYTKHLPPDDRTYGSAAEIASRDEGTGAKPAPTSFKQIGPEGSGGDASNPSFTHLSQDIKFSSGTGH